MMNLVDSSGWLEYFNDSKNAKNYAVAIEDYENLIVPSVCIYEVSRKYLKVGTRENSEEASAHMSIGKVVDINKEIALLAADLSIQHGLASADSLILATARYHNATLWTQDADFKGLEGVKYFEKD